MDFAACKPTAATSVGSYSASVPSASRSVFVERHHGGGQLINGDLSWCAAYSGVPFDVYRWCGTVAECGSLDIDHVFVSRYITNAFVIEAPG
jgi:hypothetical protein